MISIIFLILLVAIILNIFLKKQRFISSGAKKFNSLTIDYTYCYILWNLIAIILINFFLNYKFYIKISLSIIILIFNFFLINFLFKRKFNAKKHFEKFQINILKITTIIGIIITTIITITILLETLKFFKIIAPTDFFFKTTWNPQNSINNEQEVGQSSFGILPVFLGTFLITLIAMIVAVPIGIMSAIYLSMYSPPKFRDIIKPIIEILAGVPTVVYGYFAVTTISPLFKNIFATIGIEISGESALGAGFVMGVMIIPFILSLTDDAINSVPQSLKDGALALGSTKSEMIKNVVLISAMPSIISSIILAISRAIGETMIVVMSAGLVANLSLNPLNSVTTATAQIVTLLVGDQEFNSAKTLSAFALALTLFVFTFILNIIALVVMKKYNKN